MNVFFQNVAAFWQRRKWWIIGVIMLIIAAGIVANILPDTPEDRIKNAIVDYHKAKGQKVEIKELTFRSVSPAYPDSMTREYWYSRHAFFIKEARLVLSIYGADSTGRLHDSLDFVEAKAHSFDSRIDSLAKLPGTFTKCDYVALISNNSERYLDTLTVTFDERMNAVWPR